MLKTVIIDDEPKSVMLLKTYLEPYSSLVEISGTANNADDGFSMIISKSPDLVFLDISMPGSSGLDLLNRFSNRDFQVVFITAHKEYAIEAFQKSAIHYLLKPIDLLQLDEAINRCIRFSQNKNSGSQESGSAKNTTKRKIVIYTDKDYELIEAETILRCEAEGAYTQIIFTNGRKLLASQNLKAFESQLHDYNFVRIHKSHLISLDKVKSFSRGKSGYVTLADESNIQISPLKKEEFFQKLQEFCITEIK